ncbi:FtsW/RodA/SpoVE family cell cycle protein [Cytobacillus dafuensis]|uniref:Probable peptidoglycan glycosyltransferase FtsW n=1 Tax=Cytobacillus dafuensis TaxID=1742359 RepID=A0A5B8Z3A8_CYTDA|nr:FtsW/RodA/SpoVE family cell cycle protein [Cytobacillus dafuensis]QED47401.1 FtsW/RodA/SpoVE family cell cycle protein [Cytobacillus dafuensis]
MLKKILKSYDYSLIIAVALLSVFGLIMIFSASMVTSVQLYGYESDHFYNKQKVHLILGAIAFVIMAIFPYKALLRNKILVPMVFLSLFGLFAVFVFGHATNNALSWFKVGSRSLQPAEFVKLTVIIYLSAVYAKKQSYINEFNKGVVPPLVYLFLVCLLVAIQPDFGTAAIIFLIAAMIIFASGMNYKNIFKLCSIGILIVAPLLLIMKDEIFSDVRMGRFEAFANPFDTEFGYHLVNSYYALGSGGLKGLGLGNSVQKLGYLPEAHTDFIMAVIAEELGAFGVCFVLLLLGYIVLRGLYIALKCKDPFGSLLAIGISSMIGIQTFINLAGISGLIPLTGVPLPFVSYGGSSFLQLSLAMGILVNVSMFVKYEQKYKRNIENDPPEQIQTFSGKVYNSRK